MNSQPDIRIVGGGIIGLTSAYILAKSGRSVELWEQGELGRQASWAGAGIIPPGNPEQAATPIDRLRAFSTSQFPHFSAELRELTGLDNGYLRCGGIEFLPADEEELPALWQQEQVEYSVVNSGDLATLEPQIECPPLKGYRFPKLGQVRNPWHLRALIAACERLGVRFRCQQPATADPVTLIPPGGHLLIAAGAWADAFLKPLGCQVGVRPVRGQKLLFHPPRPLLTHVVIVGKRYLVPRGDGRILVGSTEEPEVGFTVGTTEAGQRDLFEFATGLIPALRSVPIEARWSGLRPGSPDGMPFIGVVPGYPRIIAAVGHFRAGVQLSLGTAQLVDAIVNGLPPPIPIEPFRVDRTPDRSIRPAFRS
mgnify:CR=1 FL=1